MARCHGCLSKVDRSQSFCPACGRQLGSSAWKRDSRAINVVALIYAGVFAVLLAVGYFGPEELVSDGQWLRSSLLNSAGLLLVGGLGALALGSGALRQSLAKTCTGLELGLGVGTGVLGFLVSAAYVFGLQHFIESPEPVLASPAYAPSLALLLVTSVVLPALIEEWLARGVLWVALSRVVRPASVIVATALLFAFMHGLNGGGELEIPHRFAVGLLFGWLRHKTGSLLPGIAAHATLNALAVCL